MKTRQKGLSTARIAVQRWNKIMIQIDMDMPKRCIECPLCKHLHLANSPLLIYACGRWTRPIYSHETAEGVDEFYKMQKPDWCPLKEAEPERKTGKWIYRRCVTGGRFKCSECGHFVDIGVDRNFCANCGAKMEKDYE